jgi:hypothetical protein
MRVLLVLPDPSFGEELERRCKTLLDGGHEVACCHPLTTVSTLQQVLDIQRRITARLRYAFDSSAEGIPVFVVTGNDGDGVDDCAAAWGATDVYR